MASTSARRMSKPALILVAGLVAVLVLVAGCWLWGLSRSLPVRHYLWEIPGGYRGWVVLRYGDPACAELETAGGYQVIPVDGSGRACTSEPFEGGRMMDNRFEYVYPDGTRVPLERLPDVAPQVSAEKAVGLGVRGHSFSPAGPSDFTREKFFVGTAAEAADRYRRFPGRAP